MILTIDVGGTKVLSAVFNDSGEMIDSEKIKTPKNYSDFVAAVGESVEKLLQKNAGEPVACGVAMPGLFDRSSGVVESFGNLDWTNVPVVEDFSKFIECPIVLENDAKAATVAEADALKDKFSRVLYITVSTGIGIGLVVDGQLDHSISDAGGTGIVLEHDGKIQSWEELASGKAIVKRTGKMAKDIDDPSEWYVIARNIALGLVDVIAMTSPECVVIGGSVGSHLPKFKVQLENELKIFTSKMISETPEIRQAQHPEQAVVYGCYLLAKNSLS